MPPWQAWSWGFSRTMRLALNKLVL